MREWFPDDSLIHRDRFALLPGGGGRGGRSRPGVPRWQDEARFIKTWLEHPRATGAVSPSSRALSRALADRVDPAVPGPVIELGPGTGPVTDALLRRGIEPGRLVLVEYEPAFCALLERRYPQCRVIQGDAYALARTLQGVIAEPAAAVVSSLPLLNRPERERLALLGDALGLMRPGSPFVQFTYGLMSPIPRHGPATPAFRAEVTAPVWLNLPPARVWTYRAANPDHGRNWPDENRPAWRRPGAGRLGEELREHRERLAAEWHARSAEAKAEWRARTQKVKVGLSRQGARLRAAAGKRTGSAGGRIDERMR